MKTDPLDSLFNDDNFDQDMIPLEELTGDNAEQIIEEHRNSPNKALVVNTQGIKLLPADVISEQVQPLIDRFNAADNKNSVDKAIRKDVVLEMYELGAALEDFHKLNMKVIAVSERKWAIDDPKFGAHLAVAKAKQKAIHMRRNHLETFFQRADNKRTYRSFQLGMVVPYDREVAGVICDMTSEGGTLVGICRELEIPINVVQKWREEVTEFKDAYRQAKKLSAEIRFDEVFDIADGADDTTRGGAQKARVQADVRMRYAGVIDRENYGEKVDLNVKGTVNHVTSLNKARKKMESHRASIMKEIEGEQVEVIPKDSDD